MELCSIASGSSGNCVYVGTDHTHLLVDAGISCKRIVSGLNEIGLKPEEIQGILVTHEHSDHIKGLGVIARKYGIPMYATPGTIGWIKKHEAIGKIDESLFHEILPEVAFSVGDMELCPMEISHDAAQPVAYRMKSGEKTMAVVTDMGRYDTYIVERLQHLDALLLEANHDVQMLQVGRYPYPLKQRILSDRGHLSNELSGRLLGEVLHDRFQTVVLGHLSQENNYPDLAYETVRLEVTMGDNPYKGTDFPIRVARRDEISEVIHI